jgi:hypothetical protein
MRDPVVEDVGELTLTEEEREAIRQAENLGRPLHGQHPLPAAPLHFGWFFLVALIILVWIIVANRFDQSRNTAEGPSSSRQTATVAIARKLVHLRGRPDIRSQSLGVIPAGAPLTVREPRSDGFYGVTYGNAQGYAATVYLATTADVELVSHTAGRIADVEGKTRVRESASLSASPILGLSAYTPITIMGFTPTGWALIWTGSRSGFVWGGLLENCPSLPFHPSREGAERVVIHNSKVLRPS